jgi:zinc/manganese transport system permease protein
MLDMFQLPFMVQALVACVLLAVVLSYFGVHVVSRGIVFIDLALAQISSAGVAFAMLTGGDPQLFALGFTLVGAVGLSLIQSNNKRVPQEAIIGIIYAVASASAILMLAKTPHGDADVTEVLFGNILAVTPAQITQMAIMFGAVGLFHLLFHRKFFELSFGRPEEEKASTKPSPLNLWNMLFYISLALVISNAIGAAGVLQVFSYLIVPAVCALLLFRGLLPVLITAMGTAVLASVAGLAASYTYDFPPGASIVACFGLIFLACALLSGILAKVRRDAAAQST